MDNLQRLEMETKGIQLDQSELSIYLIENGLQPTEEYNAQSATSKKSIYQSALGVLESIANNPELMKNIKHDDMTVSDFSSNIQNRIDQLERRIRSLKTDEQERLNSDMFMLFDK